MRRDEMSDMPISSCSTSSVKCVSFLPGSAKIMHAGGSSVIDPPSKSPIMSASIPSSSLVNYLHFQGGLSYAEANQVDSRLFWHSSTKFTDNVMSSSCSSEKKATTVGQKLTSFQSCSQRYVKVRVSKPSSLTVVSNIQCKVSCSPPSVSFISASAEHGVSDACSRSVRLVIPCVERGLLSVSEKAAVQKFVRKLSIKGSPVGSSRGKRYEWLFANRTYSYGKRVIEPCGAFSEVGHLCAGVVQDLQLAKPNACLLVYYPRGTSGLNCQVSRQVISLTCKALLPKIFIYLAAFAT